MKKLILLSALAIAAFLGVSCKKDIETKKDKYIEVKSVALMPAGACYLNPGGTAQMEARVNPRNAWVTGKLFESNHPEIADIDENGLITAKTVGEAVVFVTLSPSEHVASKYVYVTATPVAISSISMDESEINLAKGDTYRLTVTLNPENATNHNMTWTSKSPSVASVDETGLVTALGSGSAQIIAESEDGHKTAQCIVNVTEPLTALSVNYPNKDQCVTTTISKKTCYVMQRGESLTIKISTTPTSDYPPVSYSVESGKESCLSVSDKGVLTAVECCDTPIKVTVSSTTGKQLQSSFYVVIYKPVNIITLVNRPDNPYSIGKGTTQVWEMSPGPEGCFPSYPVKIVRQDGTGNIRFSISDKKLTVTAINVDDAYVSTADSKVSAILTLACGTYQQTVEFVLTKYDPYKPKKGDLLTWKNNKIYCFDGGYRGFGYVDSRTYHSSSGYGDIFALVGWVGTTLRSEDPQASSSGASWGIDKMDTPDGEKTVEEAYRHGIAIATTAKVYRTSTYSNWASGVDGEHYCNQTLDLAAWDWAGNGRSINATEMAHFCFSDVSGRRHQAFSNTANLIFYNSCVDDAYAVHPAIFVHSPMISSWFSKNYPNGSLKYLCFYYGSENNAINKYNTVSGPIDAHKCSPWLLPGVADFRSVFKEEKPVEKSDSWACDAFANHMNSGISRSDMYGRHYWTSNQKREDVIWKYVVDRSSDSGCHEAPTGNVMMTLPMLYY